MKKSGKKHFTKFKSRTKEVIKYRKQMEISNLFKLQIQNIPQIPT